MVKQAPTLGRLLVMVGFALSCFGLLLFLWLAFGGAIPLKPKGYRINASFGEATQLAEEADVRISGVPVGKVKRITPNKQTGRSTALLQIDQQFAPIPKSTKATLRQKTLLGETYVELTPGDPRSGTIPENGRLPAMRTAATVELDEIFRAFDPRTRRAFQTWIQGQAQGVKGRGLDINDTLGNLDPFAEDTQRLLQVLNSQKAAVRGTVRNTGVVFDALSRRTGQLQGLIRNGDRVFATTAQRDRDLVSLFTVLPTFNTEARTTVNRLDRFARATNPLVTQLRPAARELSPTLQQLRLLAPDLKALFRDLDPLITASKAGLPATQRFLDDLRPVLGEFDPALRQLNPTLNFIGEYKQELANFFSGPPSATQAVGSDGVHYLRTLNPQNAENLAVYPRRLGSNRTNPYRKPRGFDELDTPQGAASYDTRHCGNGNPQIGVSQQQLATTLQNTLPFLTSGNVAGAVTSATDQATQLANNIQSFIFSNAGRNVPAPPCRYQGPYRLTEGKLTATGTLSQYPQVREAASSTSRP